MTNKTKTNTEVVEIVLFLEENVIVDEHGYIYINQAVLIEQVKKALQAKDTQAEEMMREILVYNTHNFTTRDYVYTYHIETIAQKYGINPQQAEEMPQFKGTRAALDGVEVIRGKK